MQDCEIYDRVSPLQSDTVDCKQNKCHWAGKLYGEKDAGFKEWYKDYLRDTMKDCLQTVSQKINFGVQSQKNCECQVDKDPKVQN